MTEPVTLSHRTWADGWEATANVVAGCAINWTVLAVVYGQPFTATGVTVAMIGLTWLRSYAIRKVFRRRYG